MNTSEPRPDKPASPQSYRPVQPLPQEVARKIAAGEVIDRPAAIVRELLDNAIDAGASSVILELDDGGISRIRAVDNGCGMTKEDLERCAYPHTTSKISTEDDLLSLSTLGFRGEALSSISAVSRMEISSVRQGETPWKLETLPAAESGTASGTELVHPELRMRLVPAALAEGTAVQVSALFENFPARRVFLKRPASEGLLCRQTFIEKALPWPETAFKLIIDGKQKLNLRGGQTLKERYLSAMEYTEPDSFFHEQKNEQPGFSFTVILGQPEVSRSDRKHLYVFINGRRIWEYSLLQAIEYGAQGYFPNGTHPVACLFLQIDPSLIDFNIHPAKREVRFRDIAPVHRAVSSTVKDFYRNLSVASLVRDITDSGTPKPALPEQQYFSIQDEQSKREENIYVAERNIPYGLKSEDTAFGGASAANNFPAGRSYTGTRGAHSFPSERSPYPGISPSEAYRRLTSGTDIDSARAAKAESSVPFQEDRPLRERSDTSGTSFRYLGQTMGVFLLAESGDELYLIDQHAAHERLLFNRIMETAGTKQELLIPYIIETDSEEEEMYLDSCRDELASAGFTLTSRGDGSWEISSVPHNWSGTEEELSGDILKNRRVSHDLIYRIAASAACRTAVKDGDYLDDTTAQSLVSQALALPDPRCPHGRPVWTVIPREQLFGLVKR
ncbi:MAG: DNA mismatch repair endonuclease MutL [Spirochaetaceae bacterium]|nr:DNA mismatch repair endonuclease MutL [Spirochaetaceae bacterium]